VVVGELFPQSWGDDFEMSVAWEPRLLPAANRSASSCTYLKSLESGQLAWWPTMSIKSRRLLLNISTSIFNILFLRSESRASSTRPSCCLFCLVLHLLAALRFFSRYIARAVPTSADSGFCLRPPLRCFVVKGWGRVVCELSLRCETCWPCVRFEDGGTSEKSNVELVHDCGDGSFVVKQVCSGDTVVASWFFGIVSVDMSVAGEEYDMCESGLEGTVLCDMNPDGIEKCVWLEAVM
jgi:hypothetical protein